MIRDQAQRPIPQDKSDDRGLSGAMERAAEGAAEDAAKADAVTQRRQTEEAALERTTRTILFDAFYRTKRLNGDAGFDMADLDQLDAIEAEALRIGARRRARPGDAP